MDEILMREYLKHKNRGMSDSDFMRKMKEHFDIKYARGRGRGRGMRDSRFEDFMDDDYIDMPEDKNKSQHQTGKNKILFIEIYKI